MSDIESSEHKRIFLALWPDEVTRQQLFETQQKLKSEPTLQCASAVMPENLHMTLHFIGSISLEVLQALEASLDSVQCTAFDIEVNTVGYFPGPKVFWLGLKNVPFGLEELEWQTAACVQQCVEDYRCIPYRPHITLFRKVKTSLKLAIFPEIAWQIESFALVESRPHPDGVQYHVLKEWLLL